MGGVYHVVKVRGVYHVVKVRGVYHVVKMGGISHLIMVGWDCQVHGMKGMLYIRTSSV